MKLKWVYCIIQFPWSLEFLELRFRRKRSREDGPGTMEELISSSAMSFVVSWPGVAALFDTAGTLTEINICLLFTCSFGMIVPSHSCEDEAPAMPVLDSWDNRRASVAPLLFRLSVVVAALRRPPSPVLLLVYDRGRSFNCFCSIPVGRLRGRGILSSKWRSLGLSTLTISLGGSGPEVTLESLVRLDQERLKTVFSLKAVDELGWEGDSWRLGWDARVSRLVRGVWWVGWGASDIAKEARGISEHSNGGFTRRPWGLPCSA